jgi:hypothetical protein
MTDPNKRPGDPETPDSSPPSAPDDQPRAGEDEVTPELIADVLYSDEVSLSAAKTIGDAAEQVVVRLGIEKFIEQQWEKIATKLDECDEYAVAAKNFGGDMIFISMAIPLVNGIIHVGSTRDKLTATTNWIAKVWRQASLAYDPERIPVISALTLIYLITKGCNAMNKEWEATLLLRPGLQGASDSPGDRQSKQLKESCERWERMRERVQRLCSDKDSREDGNGPDEQKE